MIPVRVGRYCTVDREEVSQSSKCDDVRSRMTYPRPVGVNNRLSGDIDFCFSLKMNVGLNVSSID